MIHRLQVGEIPFNPTADMKNRGTGSRKNLNGKSSHAPLYTKPHMLHPTLSQIAITTGWLDHEVNPDRHPVMEVMIMRMMMTIT